MTVLTGRLAGNVVGDAGDAVDLVDDPRRDALEQGKVKVVWLLHKKAIRKPEFWFMERTTHTSYSSRKRRRKRGRKEKQKR